MYYINGNPRNDTGLNSDLLDVQKKRQDLTGEKQSKNMNIDKAVFVGSTSELVKFLKNNKGQE